MSRRLVMSSMTSRDYDVMLVASHLQSRRIRKVRPGSIICVETLSTH